MHSNKQPDSHTEQVRIRNEEMFSYLLSLTKTFLKMVGAWPLEADASTLEKFIKYLLNVICYTLFLFYLVPNVLYLILIPKNLQTKLKIAALSFACFGNAIKHIILMKRSKQLEICFDNIKQDWQMVELDEDYECMEYHGKYGRAIAVLSTCMVYSTTIFARVFVPLARRKIVQNNMTIKPVVSAGYYVIFKEKNPRGRELYFLGQFLSGIASFTVSLAVIALTTFFVLHTCAQLGILIRKMRDIETMKSDDGDVKKQVAEIVVHQMKIRSFIQKIVDIIEYMVMVEIAACIFLISIVLYCCIVDYSNAVSLAAYIVAIISFTYNLFIFCYVGELLADQQMKVIATSSTLDYHHLSTKSARSLILIILISNSTTKLTAGKILDLSLSNFASIFKTIIGYFNILRSVIY